MAYAVFEKYKVKDAEAISQVIADNCFATLVTQDDGAPFANHFPIFQQRDEQGLGALFGHMHKRNTQVEHLKAGQEVLAIFQGPWSYVPAHADGSKNAVPTMSFIVAHLYGRPTLVEEPQELLKIVSHTVKHFGKNDEPKWNFQIPRQMLDDLLGQIVGFRIPISRFETQFKLQQDRSMERRRSIQQYFAQHREPRHQEIAQWMEKTFEWEGSGS